MGLCLQLSALRKGLDVHGKRITPALKGMQQNLEEKLELMVFEVFPERRKKVCILYLTPTHKLCITVPSPAAGEVSDCQECSSPSNSTG